MSYTQCCNSNDISQLLENLVDKTRHLLGGATVNITPKGINILVLDVKWPCDSVVYSAWQRTSYATCTSMMETLDQLEGLVKDIVKRRKANIPMVWSTDR